MRPTKVFVGIEALKRLSSRVRLTHQRSAVTREIPPLEEAPCTAPPIAAKPARVLKVVLTTMHGRPGAFGARADVG